MVTALHVSQLPRFKELQLFEPSKNRPARRFFRFYREKVTPEPKIESTQYIAPAPETNTITPNLAVTAYLIFYR